MQGVQSCSSFCQATAVLPYSCNSVWFLPQNNGAIQFWVLPSVPGDHLKDSSPAPIWEVGLLSHLCSQLLSLFPPSFTESSAPCLTPSPHSQGRFSVPPHPCYQCYVTISCFCFSNLFRVRGFSLPRDCAGLCSWGVVQDKGESHVVWLSYSICRFTQAALKQPVGRNDVPLFCRYTLPGTGFSAAWSREVFHRLEIQDVTEFDSDWCSVFCIMTQSHD
jgi:hypothetical protein